MAAKKELKAVPKDIKLSPAEEMRSREAHPDLPLPEGEIPAENRAAPEANDDLVPDNEAGEAPAKSGVFIAPPVVKATPVQSSMRTGLVRIRALMDLMTPPRYNSFTFADVTGKLPNGNLVRGEFKNSATYAVPEVVANHCVERQWAIQLSD